MARGNCLTAGSTIGVGLALAGEMQVAHRRFEPSVAEGPLNETVVESHLQQMRRVTVAKGVD